MVRRFKAKRGNQDIVEIKDPTSIPIWRKESEYFEVDVNDNPMPSYEELIDAWNEKVSAKKAKEK